MKPTVLGTACILAGAFIALRPAPVHAQACPPTGYTKSSLQSLRSQKFTLAAADAKRALADGLLACLASPDPELRDEIAYEALTQWMRNGDFDDATLRSIRDRLYGTLDRDPGAGFTQPFAALVLSEVARTDRVATRKGWMSPAERIAMIERAATFVESIRDYRGYVNGEGWRHGVAHGADWLMQLALNPALERAHHDRILAAVATQAVPERGHAYVFGEPGRLARPVLFIAARGMMPVGEWTTWFASLVTRLGRPADDYAGWLASRHDLAAFLSAVYVETDLSEEPNVRAVKPAVAAALKAVR